MKCNEYDNPHEREMGDENMKVCIIAVGSELLARPNCEYECAIRIAKI